MLPENFPNVNFFQRGLPNTREPIIGENCVLGYEAIIDCVDQVTIGNGVFFGHRVMVLTGSHDYTLFGMERQLSIAHAPVTICDGVWVASGVIICPGVTIGDHSVIGAGSVVTRDIPPYTLAAGNPARPIRELERCPKEK